MLNKEYVESLTKTYIYSYTVAMQEVKNPDFAVQIAMNVVGMIYAIEQQKHSESNPLGALIMNIAAQALAQEKDNDNDGKTDGRDLDD